MGRLRRIFAASRAAGDVVVSAYRVRLEVFVLVDAKSNTDAKAKAELAVRKAVKRAYLDDDGFADGFEAFGFRARGSERYESGADDDE